jgi:hypothetical protein
MDEDSGKIIDFSLVQVSEVSSSNAMENEGCQRSLNKVLDQNVHVRSLSTDRHTQITSVTTVTNGFISMTLHTSIAKAY